MYFSHFETSARNLKSGEERIRNHKGPAWSQGKTGPNFVGEARLLIRRDQIIQKTSDWSNFDTSDKLLLTQL